MVATPVTFTTTRWTEKAIQPRVYVRSRWEEPWTEMPYLYCTSLRLGVGEQIDQARFEFDYGYIHRNGAANPEVFTRLSIDRKFVKVLVETPHSGPGTPIEWYGVIVANVDNRAGTSEFSTHSDGTEPVLQDDGGSPITDDAGGTLITDEAGGLLVDEFGVPILTEVAAAGRQEFTAFGMEWLFTRVYINKSVYERFYGRDVEIGRVIPFNSGTKQQLEANDVQILGNKAPGQNRFIRPDLVSEAVPWTAYDILDYLFDVFKPTEYPSFSTNVEQLVGTGPESHLSWLKQHNQLLGPTLWDAMNQLVSQRRGLTWSIEPYTALLDVNFAIRIHSFSETALTLPDSTTFPANYALISIDDSLMRHVDSVTVNDTSRMFEQVKVIGARRGSCFTLGVADFTLRAGWSQFQMEAYANAASGVTPPGELKKQADAFRASDTMANVFTRFIVNQDWDGTAANGQNPSPIPKPVCPTLNDIGDIDTTKEGPNFWMPGLRVANWIPLRENVDYQLDAADPVDNNESSVLPPYRKPFALYELPDGKFVRADRSNVLRSNEGATNSKSGITFSSFVHPLTDQFGIYVRPSSLAHVHAKNNALTDINANFDQTTDTQREVDYSTLTVTIFAEFDEHVTAVYPSIPDAGRNGQQSIQEIHLGQTARLDYLAPKTVVDVAQDGTLITNSTGGWLRDDRPLMKNIARTAWQWYSRKRVAVSLKISHISNEVAVGSLLTKLAGDDVNSLVTYITYDFEEGTTTINTDFAELDPVGLFI